ncbi:hypothetical protein M514_05321 [Trichuris suis]|uniref:Uncharacterized protein n=1 Tax=Trichuris suis TaxID=68888 RepID=A0A085M9B9_9BILA|nr:hypothetical protein M513_05321 [Trichuris suis]KFD71607.1 hypothetical protein M514_05321 [Trichuris suis]
MPSTRFLTEVNSFSELSSRDLLYAMVTESDENDANAEPIDSLKEESSGCTLASSPVDLQTTGQC